MLTQKIHVFHEQPSGVDNEDDDILTDPLSNIFRDGENNQHGTQDAKITYHSDRFGDITLNIANPEEDSDRRLFAHYLWNAEIYMAERISTIDASDTWNVKAQRVLELGAGLGLSGIVSAYAGAAEVVISDFPAPVLLSNIQRNVSENVIGKTPRVLAVQGHVWGELHDAFSGSYAGYFTRILAADCLWMPEQHQKLALSIAHFLAYAPNAYAYVVAGFHSGRDRMVPFFEVVQQNGLEIVDMSEIDVDGKRRPFEKDRGNENVFERKRWLAVAVLKHKMPGDYMFD